jgi:LysM repeat protein
MSATPAAQPNPYVGPRAFQRGEELYGRDREVMELLDLLIAERIVLLYSPSGAGKTSLVQAGLIPRLEAEAFQVLPVMRAGLEPPPDAALPPDANRYVISVLSSLEEDLPPERQMPLAELAHLTLGDYLDRRRDGPEQGDHTVLIFDQFEEILIVDPTDQAAKAEFFAQLGTALRDRQRWALFAMREEFLAGLDPYLRPLPTRLSTTYRLELLGEAAAMEAIQCPARDAGVDFTPAAAQRLVDDLRVARVQQPDGTVETTLGTYVEPVQLQVVCRRLWAAPRPDSSRIDVHEVTSVGDVDAALRAYYAERVAAIAAPDGIPERAIREWVERQLITGQGIRGQVPQEPQQSQGLDNRAIWPLVDAHLVRAEKRRGVTWFELAHDRLIEPVRADNAAWRQAHLSYLQTQAALWREQDEPAGLLLRDEALASAETWAAGHDGELTHVDHLFLTACREAQAIAERDRRQARRIRWLAAGTSLFALFAIVLAGFAFSKMKQEAKAEMIALTAAAGEAEQRQLVQSLNATQAALLEVMLNLPAPETTHTAEPISTPAPTPTPTGTPTKTPIPAVHVVQSGETLATIARWYGISVAALEQANHLGVSSAVQPGQRLIIPQPATKVTPAVIASLTPTPLTPTVLPSEVAMAAVEETVQAVQTQLAYVKATQEFVASPTPFVTPVATVAYTDQERELLSRVLWRNNGAAVFAYHTTQPPAIDGSLEEWTGHEYSASYIVLGPETWQGPDDLSATFYASWDDSYLYLGLYVRDDQHVQMATGQYLYQGDDVEIQLDTDLSGDWYQTTLSSDDVQGGLAVKDLASSAYEATIWRPSALQGPLTASLAARPADGGYTLEAALPWQAFGLVPSVEMPYGFALSLSDDDTPGTRAQESMVSSAPQRAFGNPTTWGTLILVNW